MRVLLAAAKPTQTAAAPMLQMKTLVGPVDDPLEREADLAADAVLASRAVGALSQTSAVTQLKRADSPNVSTAATDLASNSVAHGGAPLTREQRSYFEPRFGRDLSHVRLHTHEKASAGAEHINARAFTSHNNIAFASGEYLPGTPRGKHLLAHEIAHVVQGSRHIMRRQPKTGSSQDSKSAELIPTAPYRLELANPFSDAEAHASLFALMPALIGQLSKTYNIDDQLAWRLVEWVLSGTAFMTQMTYSHEEGGHAGAARRFGWNPSVKLQAPWSGVTQFGATPGATDEQRSIVSSAGVNQETLNASRLASRWALNGTINYQEAMTYLYAQTNLAAYAVRTLAKSAGGSVEKDKDDIYKYVTSQNGLSVGELMAIAAVADLLSGPAWAALIGQWNYLRHGERKVNIPSFSLGGDRRATLPNWQLLLSTKGPLLGGRSTLRFGGRFAVEASVDVGLGEPSVAMGAQLHAALTPQLTLVPFGRFSYSKSEGAGGLAGLEAQYKLTPLVGVSATLSYRKDDILSEPDGAAEGLGARAAITFGF